MSRIFFSYRRSDSLDTTKKLYRQFEKSFGIWRFLGAQRRNLFLDKDNIVPKGDFRAQIQRFIMQSDHMLVIIGDTWLEEIQHREANNKADFVLIEVESAFMHRVNVIPVLINGAKMPSRDQLPDEIKQLATQHAHQIRELTFESDANQLIKYTRPAMPFYILSTITILFLLIGIGFFINETFLQNGSQSLPVTDVALVQPTTGQEALETVFAQQTELSRTEQAFNETATVVRVQNATATAQQVDFNASETSAVTTIEFLSATPTSTPEPPTSIPTIPTPSDTPILSNDIQQTAQAEILVTETSIAGTQAVIAQVTQSAVLTEQFIVGATVTFIAQLSLTPSAILIPTQINTTFPPPIAAFTQNITVGTVPMSVNFDNQSNGAITAYEWDLGDGRTSTEESPTITYETPGTYTVNLRVTGPGGISNLSRFVIVNSLTEPERIALEGVTSNAEWGNLVGENGYVREFNGVEMVLVPAGCFVMGNDSNSYNGDEDGEEQCFDEPFWVDKTEVTQSDFERLGGIQANPSNFDGENRPVEQITWFEARDFCALRGGRLPTEAEWEYVARGPDELYFPWGNDWDANNAVWNRSSSQGTVDVGSIIAGASWVGALDMSGNVWEWTRSVYEDYPYVASDGREADLGEETNVLYALQGGSWNYADYEDLRSATRSGLFPNYDWGGSGFRCVLSYE